MRISISNIAWSPEEDEAIAGLLQDLRVDAIDVCPSKYFTNPISATSADIVAVRSWWNQRGIQIYGLQSLLFGLQDVNVFGTPAQQEIILARLEGVCNVAQWLGAERLTFGSPKQRDRTNLDEPDVKSIAKTFFRRCGDIVESHKLVLCLEPNPRDYGSNFMTNSVETATVVRYVDHPAVRMQCDTGAMAMNSEDPATTVPTLTSLIAHVHISEPHLAPLGLGGTDHGQMGLILNTCVPHMVATIEMMPPQQSPLVEAIRHAICLAQRSYADLYHRGSACNRSPLSS
jgi:sugar phosphate isomerase/epimerase